jgi:hypothetical protein
VQILLPTRTGNGKPVTQARFEEFLQELTNKFGGVTSFVRAPGRGLWNRGGDVEQDNIAVIEGHDGRDRSSVLAGLPPKGERARPTGDRDPRPTSQPVIATAEHLVEPPRTNTAMTAETPGCIQTPKTGQISF